MFDVFRNRLELSGTLTTMTALRISQGRSTEPIGSDLPVVKDALGQPLIPGSSFKGALRSRLESFLRGIVGTDRKLVANPAIDEEWSITGQEMTAFKAELAELSLTSSSREAQLHKFILENTDLVSSLFGSPWLASKFQVRDLMVQPDLWFGQYQERDGVAIDRDTETAGNQKLYDFQVVPVGTVFQFRAIVENAEPWELGLLTVGLHQFETEQIPLGGGRSRGLGVVQLKLDRYWWFDYPPHEPRQLLTYLEQLVAGQKDNQDNYVCSEQQISTLKQQWTSALVQHLTSRLAEPTMTESVGQEN